MDATWVMALLLHGQFLPSLRSLIQEKKKALLPVVTLKALTHSGTVRRKTAGEHLFALQRCTGLGELACSPLPSAPMMPALLCLPTGTRAPDGRCFGAPCLRSRRKSSSILRLMNVPLGSLAEPS